MTDVRAVVTALQDGEVAAFPTETLWALACSAFDEEAVQEVFALKQRPEGVPLALGCHSWRAAQTYIHGTPLADALAHAFMPGPVTLVVRRRDDRLAHVAPGFDTIGIRVPDDDVARRILDAAGPLVMTSANLHGQPDALTAADVAAQFPGLRIVGEEVPGTASTVVDVTGEEPIILREGAVDESAIRAAAGLPQSR